MQFSVPKLDLFYNPASGGFRKGRLAALVAAFESEGFAVTPREVPWGSKIETEADIACIHGGDGALRDTVEGLGSAVDRVPLCIAPSGTINLVARELGYEKDPHRLAHQVAAGWRKSPENWVASPLFTLGDTPVVSCLSIGPDSHAVARVSGGLKKRIGRYAYVVAMLQQMREWPRDVMSVQVEKTDGTALELEAEAVIAARGALYGGPFRLSPRAALEADHVELVVLERSTRMGTLLFTLAAMLRLPLDRFGMSEIHSARQVRFDRCVTPVQVDGDHIRECAFVIAPSGRTLRYVI